MEFCICGLGKMGGNMAKRLARKGIKVNVWNRTVETATQLAATEQNIVAHETIENMLKSTSSPKIIWLMLPSGATTDQGFDEVLLWANEGDIVVDGGNSKYTDAIAKHKKATAKNIDFADVGVSGGVWGLENGYCLMAGGEPEVISKIEYILKALAPTETSGWVRAGETGAGHYTKMVHNGIEYGMMQAYAEGFSLMENRVQDLGLDVPKTAEAWRHSSVVRSWLLDLCVDFLNNDETLNDIKPFVSDSGEGRWTAEESIAQGIPTPVMTAALYARFSIQGKGDWANKALAAMRKGFGGHDIKKNN